MLNLVGLTYTYKNTWHDDGEDHVVVFSSDPNEVLLTLFFTPPSGLSCNSEKTNIKSADPYDDVYGRGLPHLLSNYKIEQETIDSVFRHWHKDYQKEFIIAFLRKGNLTYPSQSLILDYLKLVIAHNDSDRLSALLSDDCVIVSDEVILHHAIKFAIMAAGSQDNLPCLAAFHEKFLDLLESLRTEIALSPAEVKTFNGYRERLLRRYDDSNVKSCDNAAGNDVAGGGAAADIGEPKELNEEPTISHIGFQVCFKKKIPDKFEILSIVEAILKTTEKSDQANKKQIVRAVTSEVAFSAYLDFNREGPQPIILTLQEWALVIEGIEFIARRIKSNVQALIGTFIVEVGDNKTVAHSVHIECGPSASISVNAKHEADPSDLNYCSSYATRSDCFHGELCGVELVHDNRNKQTISYIPIIQTACLTHVIDICLDATKVAAATRLLRNAIRNSLPIDPRVCYTLISTTLYYYGHSPDIFAPGCRSRVYAAVEMIDLCERPPRFKNKQDENVWI